MTDLSALSVGELARGIHVVIDGAMDGEWGANRGKKYLSELARRADQAAAYREALDRIEAEPEHWYTREALGEKPSGT